MHIQEKLSYEILQYPPTPFRQVNSFFKEENVMTKRKINYNRLYGILLHELGHALKLNHMPYDCLMKQSNNTNYITHFEREALIQAWG